MEASAIEEPPSSNEAWFNQESNMIKNEDYDIPAHGSEKCNEITTTDKDPSETDENTKGAEYLLSDNSPNVSDQTPNAVEGKGKLCQINPNNDISPDELDATNEFLPSGCELNPTEFNDDRDVEIIKAFQQGNVIYLFST